MLVTRLDVVRLARALGAAVAMTLAFTWPIPARMASHLAGPSGDNYIFLWNLWWFRESLWHQLESPFTTKVLFHPHGASLAYHTTALLNTLPGSLGALVIPLPVVFNLSVLAQFVFAWWAMFWCARLLLRRFGPAARPAEAPVSNLHAAFIATAYAFAPIHVAHLGHLNILTTGVLPLVVWTMVRAHPRWDVKGAIAFGASLGLCVLADGYFLVIGGLLLLLVRFLVLRRERALTAPTATRVAWRAGLAGALAFAIAGAPAIVPALMQGMAGADRAHAGGSEEYIADLIAYVLPSPFHPLWGASLQPVHSHLRGNLAENVVFPTFTVWILALVGWRRARRETIPWLLVAGAFLLLSLGPSLHVAGKDWGVPLPKLALDQIPWVWGARAAGRFAIATQFALAIAAGFGFRAIASKRARGQSVRTTRAAAAMGGLLFECLAWPLPTTPIAIPAPYAMVGERARRGDSGALLEIPPVHANDKVYQLYQTAHEQPLLGGRLARIAPDAYQHLHEDRFIHRTMSNVPWGTAEDSLSLDGLDSLRIRYVALHGQFPPTGAIRRVLAARYESIGPPVDGVEILRRRTP